MLFEIIFTFFTIILEIYYIITIVNKKDTKVILMKIGLYLRELRLKNNLTTKQVEMKTGISNSYISLIERNKRKPSAEILHKLAKAYGVKTEDLLRFIGYLPPVQKKINFNQIPIYNIVLKQKPFFVSENIEGYTPFPPGLESCTTKNFIAIRAKNKGMTCKGIEIGDILIIRKQSEVENEIIALISLNSKLAIKKIIKQNKHIILQSTNSDYCPILVKESDDFKIIGKVEWVMHKF